MLLKILAGLIAQGTYLSLIASKAIDYLKIFPTLSAPVNGTTICRDSLRKV